MSSVEVVDSSSARRRGAGQVVMEEEVDENYSDEYEKGTKERDRERPVGIGMESRYTTPSNKDSDDHPSEISGKGKWDKLIPRQNEPVTPVSLVYSPLRAHPSQLITSNWQMSAAKNIGRGSIPYLPLIVYTILALFTRLYKIGDANSVVWDEVSLNIWLIEQPR